MSKTTQPAPLTDAQREVLATAVLRADGAVALRDRIKGGAAAAKVGQALLGKALVREIRTKADQPVWRHDAETGRSFSLVLTKAGRTSAAKHAETVHMVPGPARETSKAVAPASALAPATASDAAIGSLAIPRSGSKIAEVVALLRRGQGTSVDEMMAVTGWLPHTTRAALTGLRKRGYAVTRVAAGTGSVYRIAETAPAAA